MIDDKGPKQRFEGQARRDITDLKRHPIDKDGRRVIVLRGDAFDGYKVDREEVAAFSWKIIGRRQTCLVVHDELKEAASGGQWKSGLLWLPRSFSQGREVGLSQLWGTQDTQEVPAEAFNQSSSLLCFKIAGNGLRLLRARDYISDGVDEVILSLPGDDVRRPRSAARSCCFAAASPGTAKSTDSRAFRSRTKHAAGSVVTRSEFPIPATAPRRVFDGSSTTEVRKWASSNTSRFRSWSPRLRSR